MNKAGIVDMEDLSDDILVEVGASTVAAEVPSIACTEAGEILIAGFTILDLIAIGQEHHVRPPQEMS